MKKDYKLLKRIEQRNNIGKQAEQNDDLEAAIKVYEENIKEAYTNAFAFERLMIIYRKLKQPRNELRVIKKGISVFTRFNEGQMKASVSTRKNKKHLIELSNLFMTKAGLKDKKGNSTHLPEPVNKWMKRKTLVEKKMNAAKAPTNTHLQ